MELREYIAPLRKWWWLILATTLVAALSSYAATRNQPPIYRANATLLIGSALEQVNPTGGEIVLASQLAQTYVELAKMTSIRQSTGQILGLERLPEYVVSNQPNTQLIRIDVTDTSTERAIAVANELARQLVQRSPTSTDEETETREAFINEQLDRLEINIQQTQDEITAKQLELAESFSAREISELQNQITALENKLLVLQANYSSMRNTTQEGASNTISIVQMAEHAERVGPNKPLTIAATALIGLILATTAAYLLEYIDDRMRSPEEIEQISGLPALAGIAHIKSSNGEYHLVTLKQPRSPIAEAYRSLRTAVQFSNVDKPSHTILVTSANPSEGKSLTAANLAVVMAQAGHKTLLVDADLRKPVQHRIFGLNRRRGLTNLFLEAEQNANGLEVEQNGNGKVEKQNLEDVFQPVSQLPGLHIITSGPIPPNPSELLGSVKMKAILANLLSRFDYVIFDSPPILAVTDSIILSTQMDSVVLVVNVGQTRRAQLKRALKRLNEMNAKLIGTALNRLSRRNDGYGYYYQDDYYLHDLDVEESSSPVAANGNGHANGGLLSKISRRKKQTTHEEK
jgi:succinoglycan biosynthesis transport protein ExoP